MAFVMGYQKAAIGNVGDDLNPWLFEKCLPDIVLGESRRLLLGIGSILVSERWDDYEFKLVLGSGARSSTRLPRLDESWDVRFVRGPRTAGALGDPDKALTDPALLLGKYVRPARGRKGLGIVPYYKSGHRLWQFVAAQCGARLISPRLPVDAFVEALNGCERVFCEAMHGSIFADALRIPWRPVSFQNVRHEGDTHHFKWSDWTGSVDLAFDPIVQSLEGLGDWPPSGLLAKPRSAWDRVRHGLELGAKLRRAARADAFMLSSDTVFADRLGGLERVFEAVNQEFR